MGIEYLIICLGEHYYTYYIGFIQNALKYLCKLLLNRLEIFIVLTSILILQ